MAISGKGTFKDDWLVQALMYYQIIEKSLYEELSQRFTEAEYFFDVLTQNGYLEKSDIAIFIEKALKIPTVNLDKVQIDPKLIEQIPEDICNKYILIPFASNDKQVSIACFNTSNLEAEAEIEQLTGKYVKTFFAFKEQINTKINEYYSPDNIINSLVSGKGKGSNIRIAGEEGAQKDSPVVKLVNQVLAEAIDGGASDIHIEPKETKVLVRNRIDGVLRSVVEVPRTIQSTLMSRIKIISNLNIAETRKPQDGKAKVYVNEQDIDLRVSILPTSYGEKCVIRILDKRKAMVSFEKMGIRGHNREYLEKCFEFKQGMVLVTGPTGSGKSTTLYAAINRVRSVANNILTIEDPIEYMMEGINQVQVNEKAGITFASALRSFLRQDPDVILVGEVRDKETADIAIQAALTGHLVLSTLHTNDTFATITRLRDMGIDKFKITESLQAIVAQRLVRKLCPDCRVKVPADQVDLKLSKVLQSLNYNSEIYEAKGCQSCGYIGYKGRIGVYEILLLSSELKDMINNDADLRDLRKTAKSQGFRNLFEDALSLISDGITDYKEILRTIHAGGNEEASQPAAAPLPEVAAPEPTIEAAAPSGDLKLPSTPDSNDIHPPQPTPTSAVPTTPPVVDDNRPKRVLVVEDFKVSRKMIRSIIEKSTDMKVSEAEDGISALEVVKKEIPDIILLDIMMPRMDGYEFLQQLRADPATAEIPVLMLTGLKSSESEVKGFDLGADDYITKPIQKDILLARLKRVLNRKRTAVAPAATTPAPAVTPAAEAPPPSAMQQPEQPAAPQDSEDSTESDISFKLI